MRKVCCCGSRLSWPLQRRQCHAHFGAQGAGRREREPLSVGLALEAAPGGVCAAQVRNDGLLWVWGEGGRAAAAEAAATPAAAPEELDDPSASLYLSPWFMRDVPYGADTLVENVLDPSHVPFSHHGTIGGSDRGNPSLYKCGPDNDFAHNLSAQSRSRDAQVPSASQLN